MKSILQMFKQSKARTITRVFVVLIVAISAVAMPYAADDLDSFSLIGGSRASAWACTLSVSAPTITAGESATLSWTTIRSTNGTIDNGVGDMTPIAKGSKSITPTADTTYTATVYGPEGVIKCSTKIKVTTLPPAAPATKIHLMKMECPSWSVLKGNENASNLDDTDGRYTEFSNASNFGAYTPNPITPSDIPSSCKPLSGWSFKLATDIGQNQNVSTVGTTNANGELVIPFSDLTSAQQGALSSGNRLWISEVMQSTHKFAALRCHSDALNGDNLEFISDAKLPSDIYCIAYNVKNTPPPSAPTCTLAANPTTVTTGSSVNLSWTTTNATTGSINNGVGDMSPIAGGSKSVSPTTDTTYTATVTGPGGTATCTAPVTVTVPVTPLTCDAFTASPNALGIGGGATSLQWETTGATDVSIDNGVGSVSVDGSKGLQVTSNTTYTLTAKNATDTVTCATSVSVETGGGGGGGGGGGSSAPRCDLFRASDTNITAGEKVTLRWETRRGTELRIEDDRNNEIFETNDDEEADEGEVIVRPVRDTRYTLTVEKGSQDDDCTVRVDVSGQNVSLISDRDQQPLTSISLTQVPYTGFDAGPFLTSVFYTLLVLWSMSVAYVLVIKKGAVFGFMLGRKEQHSTAGAGVLPHAEYRSHVQYPQRYETKAAEPALSAITMEEAPANLPTGEYGKIGYASTLATEEVTEDTAVEETVDEVSARLEERAHTHNVLLSSDALRLVADHADSEQEQAAFLDQAIARAKEAYPREDGWIVLNSERLKALFIEKTNPVVVSDKEVAHEKVGAGSLAEAIVTGNVALAYSLLGDTPMIALANATADLDAIFRARRGEQVTVSDMLVRASSDLSEMQLEAIIAALVSAIDGVYQDEGAAVKLAIMKAIKAIA